MEKIKKFWKEISIFGVIAIVFFILFAYNRIMFADYSTISAADVIEKIEDKESFIVVVGNNTDNNTIGYQKVMKSYVDENRGDTLYFVDFSNNGDTATEVATKFMLENFEATSSTLPQTYVVKDGEVIAKQEGILTYASLQDLYKLN